MADMLPSAWQDVREIMYLTKSLSASPDVNTRSTFKSSGPSGWHLMPIGHQLVIDYLSITTHYSLNIIDPPLALSGLKYFG